MAAEVEGPKSDPADVAGRCSTLSSPVGRRSSRTSSAAG
jgi:hypothetical protein